MYAKQFISVPVANATDYSRFLRLGNLKFKEANNYFYRVGSLKNTANWNLEVSCIWTQVARVLKEILPILVEEKVPFQIVKDEPTVRDILNGTLGQLRIGKIISVYPQDNQQAVRLATKLAEKTNQVRGPQVPGSAHLGGTVYTWFGNPSTGLRDCNVPFKLPKGVNWPFTELAKPPTPPSNIINSSYLLRDVAKFDAKGNVYKALWLKGFRLKTCILKEGLHDMFVDSHERDIRERLRWQSKALTALSEKIRVPKVYEFFELNGNSYLSMEFIDGRRLSKVTSDLHEDQAWFAVQRANKLKLLDYLIQVVEMVKNLHKEGYIHRDITPANFIVDNKEKIWLIDLELAYDHRNNVPVHAFESGLNGFTAPERTQISAPSTSEDVYSLGALMMVIFANIYPPRSDTRFAACSLENLTNLIGEKTIALLISSCLNPEPKARPTLSVVAKRIQEIRLTTTNDLAPVAQTVDWTLDHGRIEDLVEGGIHGLTIPFTVDQSKIWQSNIIGESAIANAQKGLTQYYGLHTGISGPIYVIARAKQSGYSIRKVHQNYLINYKKLLETVTIIGQTLPTGLYNGTAGIAMAVAAGIQGGLVPDTTINKRILTQCLASESADELDIEHGRAGIGLAVLHCLPFLAKNEVDRILGNVVDHLVNKQNKNGSWMAAGGKANGLSNGIAGITTFLIEYARYSRDSSVASSAVRALTYLENRSNQRHGKSIWLVSDKTKVTNPWLNVGFTGVALCFIRAYNAFKNENYKKIATSALQNHPANLIANDLSVMNGITGIGHVYVEAFRAFRTEEWLTRAHAIARVIAGTFCEYSNGSYYWHIDTKKVPTADFMVGTSGIIDFLIACKEPEKTTFPLLPDLKHQQTVSTLGI